ncbi:MAG: prolyl-tRNA synthetase associated domain-containing protein [Acholeplasmataceae bacterium]|nr:prolyl-tRNA synthetase associated domain-containing protein [Acholeplasmataceae bacterium]
MNSVRQKVFAALADMHIAYEVIEHPAVYTIDEMDQLTISHKESIVKNLFVRDDKKRNYFLIVLQKDKHVDLKRIKAELSCRPLGFASEDDLAKYLGLNKGAVTPFGVLNDSICKVTVVFDQDILSFEQIGVHPNENTATVLLKPQDLEAIIKKHGNEILHINI